MVADLVQPILRGRASRQIDPNARLVVMVLPLLLLLQIISVIGTRAEISGGAE